MKASAMKALHYKIVAVTMGFVALALIGGFWVWGEFQDRQAKPDMQNEGTLTPQNDNSRSQEQNAPSSAGQNNQNPDPGSQSGNVKNITLSSQGIGYDLEEIKVKQGDQVRITFNNTGGFHDWVLDEFNARTPRINAGQTASVTFTADKKGTFEYYCSVGNHRQMGMVGKFIVE